MNIDINEMKKFFFNCSGDGMSMHRANEEKYWQYRAISETIVEEWRQELISIKFEELFSRSKGYAFTASTLLRLIHQSNSLVEYNFEKLLRQITIDIPTLDKFQRVLLLEDFAGRTVPQQDGGIYFIHTQTNLTPLLKSTIDHLAKFSVSILDHHENWDWRRVKQRHKDAKKLIQSAYLKFGIKAK